MARIKVNGSLFDENLHRFPFSHLFSLSLGINEYTREEIEKQAIFKITSTDWYKCIDQYVNMSKVVSIRIDDVERIDD